MKLSFRYRFEAAHRFTKSSSAPCMTPHGHSWYANLIFESHQSQLNECQMLAEFQTLKSLWKKFITEIVDHSFLHHYNDPILKLLQSEIPQFRGLPFPGDPTTELISILFLRKAQAMATNAPALLLPTEILIEETPVNHISVSINDPIYEKTMSLIDSQFKGWWSEENFASRQILPL